MNSGSKTPMTEIDGLLAPLDVEHGDALHANVLALQFSQIAALAVDADDLVDKGP